LVWPVVRLKKSGRKPLDAAADNASGVTAKGIEAIRLQAQGYSCKEIGQLFGGAPDNHVSAWISRARKYLRQDPAIAAFVP
jgi:DNA-binding CsgD family transcriptional regulator